MGQELTLNIDGVEVPARSGQTILEAADAAGIYIPRLCYLKGLAPWGSCRVCTVMANGRPNPACVTPVTPGMVVENDTPELLRHRRTLIEMLFVEGNHYCMFCEASGRCELQALAYRFGLHGTEFPYLYPDRKVDATHPAVFLDHNRCILCARCVRASRDVDGKHAVDLVGRGRRRRIGADARDGLGGTGIDAEDRAMDVCPVGALVRKYVGYNVPIGRRKYDVQPIGAEIEAKRVPPEQPQQAGESAPTTGRNDAGNPGPPRER